MSKNTGSWGIIAGIILLLAVVVYLILTIYPNIFPGIPKEITVLFTTGIIGLIVLLVQQSIKLSMDTSLESHKKELEKKLTEHQIRFTRLHQNRADAIAKLYSLLTHAQRDLQILSGNFEHPEFNSQLETTGEGELGYEIFLKSVVNFYLYFDENRIYFSEDICEKLDALLEKSFNVQTLYWLEHSGVTPLDKTKPKDKALNIMKTEIPELRKELEQEFQKILGAVNL